SSVSGFSFIDEVAISKNESLLSASSTSKTLANASQQAVPLRVSTNVRELTANQKYFVYATAVDQAGNESLPSNIVDFTTNGEQPLPIELKDFYATVNKGFVRLTWTTVSETNNDYFTVERSLDRKTFKELGTVDGSGNSTSLLEYNFDDDLPVPGLIYYRIKQTDTNGVFDYSHIINVNYNDAAAEFSLNVYPNPVSTPEVYLKLKTSNTESPVSVKIVDLLGKVHMNRSFEANELINELSLDRSSLSGGIYIFLVQQADRVIKKKVIIDN